MKKALLSKLTEALTSVLPVFAIVLVLSFTPLAPLSWQERIVFTVCAVFLMLGIALFNLGADLAMSPIGRHVGEGLTKSGRIKLLFAACFLMGVLITVAEPDLSVLAGQISEVVKPMALISTVGVGVGLFLVLAVLRIVTKTDLTAMLLFFYMLLFSFASLMIARGGESFLPLAFDSGGVTTGPITVPFIMALGIGIAQTIGGRNAGQNGLDNCDFICGDVLKVVDELKEKPDMIVLDPPREGIHPKAMPKILRFGVDTIVYISCKATSLKNDLAALQAAGYRVKRGCTVDLFPGTVHVETCVLLVRESGKDSLPSGR